MSAYYDPFELNPKKRFKEEKKGMRYDVFEGRFVECDLSDLDSQDLEDTEV